MRFLLFLALFAALFDGDASWNRIDVHCIVHGLPPQDLYITDNGNPMAEVGRFVPDIGETQIIMIENPRSLYKDAYAALDRRFPGDDVATRKILAVSGKHDDAITESLRWELAFLALRRHVIIYGVGPSDSTVAALAEETGGRIVAAKRDLESDIRAMRRVVAKTPPHDPKIGLFHALEIRGSSNGPALQAPKHYYITPPWIP